MLQSSILLFCLPLTRLFLCSSAAHKKQYGSLCSGGAQLFLVTGTLARAKSFLAELYRPGEAPSPSSSASPSTERPTLENSSSDGSLHVSNRKIRAAQQAAMRGGGSVTNKPSSSLLSDLVVSPAPAAAAPARGLAKDSHSTGSVGSYLSASSSTHSHSAASASSHHSFDSDVASVDASGNEAAPPLAGARKHLVECVAALLARSGGDELIGALCNDVFRELHGTLADLAQSDRAKEFFSTHSDVFEVYGPLTQKRVRFVANFDRALVAAGEQHLAAQASTSTPPSYQQPGSPTSASAGAWSQFAKRIKEAAVVVGGGGGTVSTPRSDGSDVLDQLQAPQQLAAPSQMAHVQQHQQQHAQVQQQQQHAQPLHHHQASAAHQLPPRSYGFEQQGDEAVLLSMFSPLDPARAAVVNAARGACRHRFAALSVLAQAVPVGQPSVCLIDSVAAVQQAALAMRGAVVAVHLWRRRQPLAAPPLHVLGETANDTHLISLVSLCVMAFTSGDAFVVDFQTEATGGDRSVAVACSHLLRDLIADESTTVLFSDAVRDGAPLLGLYGAAATRARIIDVRHAWTFFAELRERAALPQSALGSVQNVPSLSVLLEHYVGLPAAQRYVARLGAASAVSAGAQSMSAHIAWHEVRPLSAQALAAAAAEVDGAAGVLRGIERQAAQLFLSVVRTTTQATLSGVGQLSSSGGPGSGGSGGSGALLAPLVSLLLPTDAPSSGGGGGGGGVGGGGVGSSGSATSASGASAGNAYGAWGGSSPSLADPIVSLVSSHTGGNKAPGSPSFSWAPTDQQLPSFSWR